MHVRLIILVVLAAIVVSACSNSSEAKTCDDIAAQTIALLQELIVDLDAQSDSLTVDEFLQAGDNLPSIESFRKESAAIDDRAAELGCTTTEVAAGVAQRVGDLTARTQLGRFVISLLTTGGL